MRKIVTSGLVAAAALLGCAGPAVAGTGHAVTAGSVTPATASSTAALASLKAIAARYPAGSAAARIVGSYMKQLSPTEPQASVSSAFDGWGAVSCASPTACLSVGAKTNTSSGTGSVTPFAARLHAGTWQPVPVKAPKGALLTVLTGVSCKSATYCLAIGWTLSKSANAVIADYAVSWNGTTLTPITAPPMPAHTLGELFSVSCVAVKSCVAIGHTDSETTNAESQIVWTWNGTRWARTVVPAAASNTVTEYTGLRCFSLTSCAVIGQSEDMTSGDLTPLAASWNGTAFHDLKAPLPSGTNNASFASLSCASAHSCAAVGEAHADSSDLTSLGFADVWNGRTWKITKWSGPKGDTETALLSVSCTSAVRCMAVGQHGTESTGAPAALAWDGRRWTVLKVPGAKGVGAFFESVSCPVNGKCVVVGRTGAMETGGPWVTPIAGYWNGNAWKYSPMFPATAA